MYTYECIKYGKGFFLNNGQREHVVKGIYMSGARKVKGREWT
jgi:hypothetical protein